MCVDNQVLRFVKVPRNMPIGNSMPRKALQETDGVIVVVDAVDIDVVYIQQQVTVGFFEHGRDEFNFT